MPKRQNGKTENDRSGRDSHPRRATASRPPSAG